MEVFYKEPTSPTMDSIENDPNFYFWLWNFEHDGNNVYLIKNDWTRAAMIKCNSLSVGDVESAVIRFFKHKARRHVVIEDIFTAKYYMRAL